ncbi:PREDICTED: transcription elongation factor B polypeptide 2-like, partial [Elephantulus edwardii]|uniref:transcription elongation factor B polypeptide 2-like n=1 Tax=Elephantulus edwardii TaxID=28737 RepID=UPI0003F0E93B
DVFLMIRRHKTTIFTDAKELSTVYELKRIIEGILKRPPDEQRLHKDDQLLENAKTLGECSFTSQTAGPQALATVGLAFRSDDTFEALRIEPFSSPPELPILMKPQDSGSSANEKAVTSWLDYPGWQRSPAQMPISSTCSSKHARSPGHLA